MSNDRGSRVLLEEGEEEMEEVEGVETMAVEEAPHPEAVAATTVGRMGIGQGTARLGTGETSATDVAGTATSRGAAATVLGLSKLLAYSDNYSESEEV